MLQRIVLLAALALANVASAAGYYLPGTYPQEFFIGQQLQGEFTHDMDRTVINGHTAFYASPPKEKS